MISRHAKKSMKDPQPYLMKNGSWALKGTWKDQTIQNCCQLLSQDLKHSKTCLENFVSFFLTKIYKH